MNFSLFGGLSKLATDGGLRRAEQDGLDPDDPRRSPPSGGSPLSPDSEISQQKPVSNLELPLHDIPTTGSPVPSLGSRKSSTSEHTEADAGHQEASKKSETSSSVTDPLDPGEWKADELPSFLEEEEDAQWRAQLDSIPGLVHRAWLEYGRYFGQWDSVLGAHGVGRCEYVSGDVYQGEWSNNRRQGRGRCRFGGQRLVYEGEWEADEMQGEGKLTAVSGACYEGGFVKSLKHGRGKQTFPDGACYEGEFEGGERSGRGRLQSANGNVYEGEWLTGKMHGPGHLRHAAGRWDYRGEWQRGTRHGTGRLEYSDGAVYEGAFARDALHGHGSMAYPSGARYTGEWEANQRHGEGLLEQGGDTYQGYWERGQRAGLGRQRLGNGEVYEGGWEGGRPHGFGSSASTAEALAYSGQFARGRREGPGRAEWADGAVYDGEWREGLRHGRGVHSSARGDRYEGEWQRGQRHGAGTLWLPAGGPGSRVEELETEKGSNGLSLTPDKEGAERAAQKRPGEAVEYRGQFVHDVRHGRGVERWRGAEVYVEYARGALVGCSLRSVTHEAGGALEGRNTWRFRASSSERAAQASGWGGGRSTEGGGAAARKVLLQGQAPLVLEGWRAEKRLQLLDSRGASRAAKAALLQAAGRDARRGRPFEQEGAMVVAAASKSGYSTSASRRHA